MARVDFVFTNPGHHHAMMKPVAAELAARGHETRLVSLAELRGFRSPASNGVPVVRAFPLALRKNPNVGDSLGAPTTGRRRLVQTAAWLGLVGPRLHLALRRSDAVVIPNDAVFPYAPLVERMAAKRLPWVLMQEGIRFPLPNEKDVSTYGAGGANAVCCWGAAAAEHFSEIGAAPSTLRVTGNPRYDAIDPAAYRAKGDALLARLKLTEKPLLFLSNPIDDQGFCSTDDKLALFAAFVRAAGDAKLPVVAKLHPREDVAAFRKAAPGANVLDAGEDLFAVLAAGRAAVVLASTVGLEALLFGLPLGVLAIPGHGHAFEYVSRGAAMPLAVGDTLARDLAALASSTPSPQAGALLDRHLAHRGRAAAEIASAIEGVLR